MALPISELIDIAVEENIPPSNYFTKWYELGEWQFETLKDLGLRPSHTFLDVGCGPLRLGYKLIPFLDNKNYYGIDAVLPLINVGKNILKREGITKEYTVLHNSDFEFDKFNTKFDYAIAASVFTYSGLDKIQQCVVALKKVMKPASTFLFTYILQKNDIPVGTIMDGIAPMRFPALRDSSFFEEVARRNNISFRVLTGKNHPTGQIVAVFEF